MLIYGGFLFQKFIPLIWLPDWDYVFFCCFKVIMNNWGAKYKSPVSCFFKNLSNCIIILFFICFINIIYALFNFIFLLQFSILSICSNYKFNLAFYDCKILNKDLIQVTLKFKQFSCDCRTSNYDNICNNLNFNLSFNLIESSS